MHATRPKTRYRPGGGETIRPRQWQLDGGKNRSGSTSGRGGGAVRTPPVADDGKAAGSQRAYSLGSCAMRQTD